MSAAPELEKPQIQPQEGVIKEIPDIPELPSDLKEHGVLTRPTQVTAQVTDDKGNSLIQTPVIKTVTITIPTTQQQLSDWSEGSPDDSKTWFGAFWSRIVKKAVHFGWKIIAKGGQKDASAV